jgi:membrane fusion protein, multidrug efflux system
MHTPARRLTFRILPLAASLLVAACGPSQQPGAFHGFPPSEVTTVVMEPNAVPASYEYVGQTAGSKEVEVRARVTGILEQKLFQEGSAVKAGQVLFVIDPKPLAAQAAALEADLVRAQAQKAQSDREVARLKPLAEKRAVGQKEADDAMSNAELAAASVKAAQAKLDEAKIRRQSRHRQRHAAHDDLAGQSDLDSLRNFRERAAWAQSRGKRGPAHAAQGQCL